MGRRSHRGLERHETLGRVRGVAPGEMKPAALLPLLVVLAACGSQAPGSAAHPSAPPAAQATPSATGHAAETLFAVLESSRADFAPDTIAIAGLDGRARAKTHFKPRPTPWVGP